MTSVYVRDLKCTKDFLSNAVSTDHSGTFYVFVQYCLFTPDVQVFNWAASMYMDTTDPHVECIYCLLMFLYTVN